MVKKIVIFSLLCFLMGGCIKEDRDDCGRFRLQFRYTRNNTGQDLLAGEVRDIRVYVFEQGSGLLSDVIVPAPDDIARGYLDIDIPNGLYSFVSWAGGGPDLTQGGYTVQASVGNTTPNDFRLMLTTDSAPGGKGGTDAVPRLPDFDNLFYACAPNVEAVGGKDQTVDLDFIKNTSTVQIIVRGLEHLTGTVREMPLDIFISGRNYQYGSDNSILDSTPCLLSAPSDEASGRNMQQVWIRQQRLSMAHCAVDPVRLHIRHTEGDYDLFRPLDLMDAILQNPAYPDQEAIDREDLFVIELSILIDLKVRVTVNDWEIVILDPDITGTSR